MTSVEHRLLLRRLHASASDGPGCPRSAAADRGERRRRRGRARPRRRLVLGGAEQDADLVDDVVAQPRHRAELHPVGLLVQAHPQPEVRGSTPSSRSTWTMFGATSSSRPGGRGPGRPAGTARTGPRTLPPRNASPAPASSAGEPRADRAHRPVARLASPATGSARPAARAGTAGPATLDRTQRRPVDDGDRRVRAGRVEPGEVADVARGSTAKARSSATTARACSRGPAGRVAPGGRPVDGREVPVDEVRAVAIGTVTPHRLAPAARRSGQRQPQPATAVASRSRAARAARVSAGRHLVGDERRRRARDRRRRRRCRRWRGDAGQRAGLGPDQPRRPLASGSLEPRGSRLPEKPATASPVSSGAQLAGGRATRRAPSSWPSSGAGRPGSGVVSPLPSYSLIAAVGRPSVATALRDRGDAAGEATPARPARGRDQVGQRLGEVVVAGQSPGDPSASRARSAGRAAAASSAAPRRRRRPCDGARR